jgi:preprotein translocase subunit SecF
VGKRGFSTPDVIRVEDARNPHRFLIRVQEVSTISQETRHRIERKLCFGENLPAAECPPERRSEEIKFSPGGDKITVRFGTPPDLDWIKTRLVPVTQIRLRPGANNPSVQNARDNKVEVQLSSKGDQLMSALKDSFGHAKVPDVPLRTEWIGPKAGAQLRDSAIKSLAIALILIMCYIAFRFDLRFAPGAVIAVAHDALGVVGILVLLKKELNLTTVAAVLTIVGFSVNDTVVVFDRVRENMGKMRGASFPYLINVSISEMLSRTLLSSATVIFSLLAFFIWGTGAIKEFAYALIIGITLGTYSSIYVALPLTYWIDVKFISKMRGKKATA